MKLFNRFKRAIGLKNRYAVQEIKEGGKLLGAVLLNDEECATFNRKERIERFRQWQTEQGV
jgi:hypothetical protein